MLGVDRDGAFAEFIVVPVRIVHRVPASVSWAAAAYAEPIAAALAALDAGLAPSGRTLLLGGAIVFLACWKLPLRLHGHQHVTIIDSSREMERAACRFVRPRHRDHARR